MKHLILTEYDECWLEEIEDDVIDVIHKTAKEMLVHLLTQCMKLINWEKRAKLKKTWFTWLEEEDVTIYFSNLDKEQERLNKMAIKWDDNQKVTQAMAKIYNSSLFDEKKDDGMGG